MSGTKGRPSPEKRTLKLVALGYVVKTLLVGIAWWAVPDLPQRALVTVRATWALIAGGGAD